MRIREEYDRSMSTPRHRKKTTTRIAGGGSSYSALRSPQQRKPNAAELALHRRRTKILTGMSWLSLALALIGLVLAFLPAGFVLGVALFLVPGFILGLLALALRSDRIWAAVAGVVLAAVGGQVATVSAALVVVLTIGGISLPNFDLSQLTKGLNLSGLSLPNIKIPEFKLPSFKIPKIGGLGGPSAGDFANFLKNAQRNSGSSIRPATPGGGTDPTPTPTPSSDPETPALYQLDEVIQTESGLMFAIVGFECDFTSVETEEGEVTPNGEFCEAHIAMVHGGEAAVQIDANSFDAFDNDEHFPHHALSSGFWLVNEEGAALGEELQDEDGTSIGPKLIDPITIQPGEYVHGVITVDVTQDTRPHFMLVDGEWISDAVLIDLDS